MWLFFNICIIFVNVLCMVGDLCLLLVVRRSARRAFKSSSSSTFNNFGIVVCMLKLFVW